uniref:GH3 domain containing n=1 Tax=Cyclopterus lumpus TaxID=8103 RepID=A0A8C2WPJ2_CYCLU
MCLHQGVTVGLDAMRRAFPATDSLQRTTKFFYSPTFRQSEAGIPNRTELPTPTSSRHMLNLYTTPAAWLLSSGPSSRKVFHGIAKRLWPHLHLVLAVDSGSNQIYGEMLRENYCRGVPFYSPFYAATEGLIGVNLWPQEPTRRYMLCPRSMFCEFLPESSLEEETPHTLLMEELEFHNQCPIVEFQYRRGQMLSVRGEKVSEALFLNALKKALAQWPGARLIDYCCAESGIMDSIGGSDPHYQVFIELKGVRNLTEEQRYKLDICLQQDSAVYKSFRFKGSIGPMRVQLVAEGAFKELRKRMMAFSNTSPNTFKMHRVLRRKEYGDFLLGKTIS